MSCVDDAPERPANIDWPPKLQPARVKNIKPDVTIRCILILRNSPLDLQTL